MALIINHIQIENGAVAVGKLAYEAVDNLCRHGLGIFLQDCTDWFKALFPLDGAGLRLRVMCLEETMVHIAVLGLYVLVKGCPTLALTVFTTADPTAVRLS